jgi:hypothetical protein
VIDAKGEIVEERSSQSILSYALSAQALIPVLAAASISANFATPSRFLARAAGVVWWGQPNIQRGV